ncbi:hypothetical protein TrCOL_g12254 [Triparma columacea]|uniref:Uncharacterized protein n=1 Tax=Triparma columacea TaxID=722753 RepID=A0A9W7L477_9STRA|nr:hypothetical protein TrCOL_g12254 [Triparma columacea]
MPNTRTTGGAPGQEGSGVGGGGGRGDNGNPMEWVQMGLWGNNVNGGAQTTTDKGTVMGTADGEGGGRMGGEINESKREGPISEAAGLPSQTSTATKQQPAKDLEGKEPKQGITESTGQAVTHAIPIRGAALTTPWDEGAAGGGGVFGGAGSVNSGGGSTGKSPKMVARASIETRMRMGSDHGSDNDSKGRSGGDGQLIRMSVEKSPNARMGSRRLQHIQESFEKGEISSAEKDRRKKAIFLDTKEGSSNSVNNSPELGVNNNTRRLDVKGQGKETGGTTMNGGERRKEGEGGEGRGGEGFPFNFNRVSITQGNFTR